MHVISSALKSQAEVLNARTLKYVAVSFLCGCGTYEEITSVIIAIYCSERIGLRIILQKRGFFTKVKVQGCCYSQIMLSVQYALKQSAAFLCLDVIIGYVLRVSSDVSTGMRLFILQILTLRMCCASFLWIPIIPNGIWSIRYCGHGTTNALACQKKTN
jgi:hypothetical protein